MSVIDREEPERIRKRAEKWRRLVEIGRHMEMRRVADAKITDRKHFHHYTGGS